MNPKYNALLAQLRTPFRLPWLVIAPSFIPGNYDSHAVDGPYVCRHQGRFYMTFIGFDGIGYRTGLASSMGLMHWRKEDDYRPRSGRFTDGIQRGA